jgi:hypothetical protein
VIIDQSRVLNRINDLRTMHRAKPLSTSIQLSDSAQAWANSLAHSPLLSKRQGENVGTVVTPASIDDMTPYVLSLVDKWYAQNALYDVNEAACIPTLSCDFTQLVWKGSNSIGIGFSMKDPTTLILVVDFSPKGNVQNTFYNNVSPAPNPTPSAPPSQTLSYVNSLIGSVNVQVMFHNSGAYNTVRAIRLRNVLVRLTTDPMQKVQFLKKQATPNYSYHVWYLIGPFSSTNIAQQFVASINMQAIIADTGIALLYVYPTILGNSNGLIKTTPDFPVTPSLPRKIGVPYASPPTNKCSP